MAEVDLNEVERYLRIFQENPDSRVFAPLADMYRRLGRLREAEEICREGLLRHPYYAGGKVALSHVLLEAGRCDESLREVEAVVTYYPDNILARKILIRVLGALNRLEEARREYEALKHLAPLVAGDAELERALQGRPIARELPPEPQEAPPLPEVLEMPRELLEPIERLRESTEWDPSAGELTVGSVSARPSRPASNSESLWENPVQASSPKPRAPAPVPSRESSVSSSMAVQERPPAAPQSPSPAIQRSLKLSQLLRRKLVLESLMRRLGESQRFS